jgi:NAD(P)H-flavin reductase
MREEELTTTAAAGRNEMLPDLYEVGRVRRETADTFTLDLVPRGGTVLPRFAAGQFNMLYVIGVGEVPISISGDPADTGRLVHTTRAVGAVTCAMQALGRGDALGVRGPFGQGWPVTTAIGQDIAIVAGGNGLAPLRPVIYEILARRQQYGTVSVLYGGRTPADLLYRRELEDWRARFDLDVHVTVDRARDDWRGPVGAVTGLISGLGLDGSKTIAMVAGPEVMMRLAALECEKQGLSADRIFVSLERNMKCGVGLCGHCQHGPTFVCKDGPVYRYDRIKDLIGIREI